MAKLIGSVDLLGRPLVRVRPGGQDDDLLAIVDTGFNGEIMMGMHAARALRVLLFPDAVDVELGTGAVERVLEGRLPVRWLDEERVAKVLVSVGWPAPKPDTPVALIGTRLLRPHLLLVDFAAGTVEIESHD